VNQAQGDRKPLRAKTTRTPRSRLLRYAFVGAGATLVHYAVLALVVEALSWPAWLGSALGALVGAQVAFFGNRVLTFRHRGAVRPAWLRFHVAAVLGAIGGAAIVALAVHRGWHYLVAQALATVVVLLATFALNARWAFVPRPPPG
jgi:putative flippase GtrA